MRYILVSGFHAKNLKDISLKYIKSCGIEKIMPWSKLNPKNKIASEKGKIMNEPYFGCII